MWYFYFSLQLIHSSVVDTAIVFPHRLGLPYKRALKNLIADHLKRIIQDNGEKMASFHSFILIGSKMVEYCRIQKLWRLLSKKIRLAVSIQNMECE